MLPPLMSGVTPSPIAPSRDADPVITAVCCGAILDSLWRGARVVAAARSYSSVGSVSSSPGDCQHRQLTVDNNQEDDVTLRMRSCPKSSVSNQDAHGDGKDHHMTSAAGLVGLTKTNLREQALASLRMAITSGQLAPQTPMVETELSGTAPDQPRHAS